MSPALVLVCLITGGRLLLAADVPTARQVAAAPGQVVENKQAVFFWRSTPVGASAQLLTLTCQSCYGLDASAGDVPLVSVLRDTLGDRDPENDRVLYVWLLSAPHVNLGQKILSAVPFFFWRVGHPSGRPDESDTNPQFDISSPERPMLNGFTRNIVQWTALDPFTAWTRASSRSYQANASDSRRFQVGETISLLKQAPVGNGIDSLTGEQLTTVIARLELRKSLLGGLADNRHAARYAEESAFESERVRSRNWELLRQCAEKTGLLFESIELGGTRGEYAILWYPTSTQAPAVVSSMKPIYKLLNIKDPWSDGRLQNWEGLSFIRSIDEYGRLLPEGMSGSRQIKLIPLGLYSLNYPRMPLLLVDFRDRLHVRLREMTQRSINQITSGIVGLSRITNWYYYAGAMAYNFVAGRHGTAVSQDDRLDCYSQFRARLTLDRNLDPKMYEEVVRRAESLTVNPLDLVARHTVDVARVRYALLLAEISQPDSPVVARLNRDRRTELARFGQPLSSSLVHELAHLGTFGLYTQRVGKSRLDLAQLARERRFTFYLSFLDATIQNGTAPEIAHNVMQIEASLASVRDLVNSVQSPLMRAHALATISRVAELSQDPAIQAGCRQTLLAFVPNSAAATDTAAGASALPPPVLPGLTTISGLSDLQ